MAAANQTTPNENLEKEVIELSSESTKMSTIPVPAQRRIKAKADESSEKINNTLSVSAIIDNSRVVFLNNDIITKNEVKISNESQNQETDMSNLEKCVVSESSENNIVKMIPPSKSKVASFIEKFNSNTTSSSVNVVICKVDVCDPINIPPDNNNCKSTESNDSKVNIISIDKDNSSQIINSKIVEAINYENISVYKNTTLENSTVKMKDETVNKTDSTCSNTSIKENTEKVLNVNESGTDTLIHPVQQAKDNNIKVPIPAPRNFTLKNRISESGIMLTDHTCLHSNVVETNSITNIAKDNSTSTITQVDKDISSKDINNCSNLSNKAVEGKQNGIKQVESKSNSDERENNKLLSQTKPTISKKPTTLGDKKAEKVFTSGKISVFEKSLSFQDRDLKIKGLRSPAERNMIELEPKLTKRQRTSSEQCLSVTKGDSEISMIRKLRVAVEQLQQENAVIKKLLESERSAFREQRAVFEAESRKEKAEAKRREASLESQLRTALKGQTVAAVGPTGAAFDNARFVAALESAKTTIKSLQEKLRVALEADKRKAAELRTQHDAHTVVIQQMERDARAQTAKLLEELKTKERQVEKVKKEVKGTPATTGKQQSKMAVAEQLHQMEGQISRLENEIQRRDDIIQSLRTSKIHRERRLSQRLSKDNIFKDILSDVDSAVSSAPNSLSPQPSPDLWYRHQDGSQVEVEEGLLEAAKKQIQELEKSLSLSTAGQKQAQLKASQLEVQLQDLREHADLLEFRCLELEDSAEKRHSIEELTDSDSGCTSPENRLKNSVSPQLRRSDSGYKSPTRSASPNIKNQRRIVIPPSFPEQDAVSCTENYKAIVNNLHLQSLESIFENGYSNDEIRDKLEGMLLKTHSESDRICLEQILQLLWNLQTLRNSFNEEDFSMVKTRKILENDINKCDLDQQTKSGKIIATVSPYSQKALFKSNDLINNTVTSDEVDLANFTLKEESKKILFGLQESGIFEEGDWESKSTQTDCYDCVCPEPESDLATEVLRLNQIREQLEKSGAIKNKNSVNVCNTSNSPLIDLKQQRRRDKKKIELYESRIALLENKLSIYESSDDVRQKKLAQRLQREVDLQTKVKNLEFDLGKLKKKYIILEEERCEFEEAENDTRFHCQELEAELDILTAKLRDLDDQRSCARNEAECYRQLVEEYEYKIMTMQQNEKDMKKKADIVEKLVPVLVSYNIYSLLEEITARHPCCANTCGAPPCGAPCDGTCGPTFGPLLMLEYPDGDLKQLGEQLSSLANQNVQMKTMGNEYANNAGGGGGMMHNTGPHKFIKDDKASQYDDNTIYNSGINSSFNNTFSSNNTTGMGPSSNDDTKLKMRIEELEKRELAYLETLTKGDEMWAEMETGYKAKLKELEENEDHLVTSLNKWKCKFEEKEKKIHEMEENEEIWRQERKAFMEDLREVKKVREDLERKNNRLQTELVDSRHALEEKERDFNLRISMVKSKTDAIKAELNEQRKSTSEIEIEHQGEVTMLKKDLRRTAEELNQYKESVRELTEVVRTLRENLNEVQFMMSSQKHDYEEKSKAMLNEIKGKSEEVDLLRTSLAQLETLPSAKDELEDVTQDATSLRSRLMSPLPIAPTLPNDRTFANNTALLPVITPAPVPMPQIVSPVIPPPVSNMQGGWDEQVTTLITIKAIKNPGANGSTSNNNTRNRNGQCTCEPISPHQGRKQYPGSNNSNRRYSDDYRRDYDVQNRDKQNNKVSFRTNDCDMLYGPLDKDSSRMINDSDINLFDPTMSTASVPAEYRAKKSPESVDVTGGIRINDQKCTCKSSANDHSNRDRSQPRSSSDGRTTKDGEFKNGDQKRSCSCSRPAEANTNNHCGCSNPPVSCYCCGCRQTVDKPCNRHRPIPLLLLTKTTDSINQQNKAIEKPAKSKTGKGKRGSVDLQEIKDKKRNSKTMDKPLLQTHERSTSYCAPENCTEKSTSFHSGDLYGNTGMVDHSTSYNDEPLSPPPSSKKPEVPSRKPKLPKGKPPKPGDKKGNKKDDKKDGVLRLPPLHIKETIPCESLENTMSKMLCESLESCLDERTYIVCQQLVGDVRNVLDFIPEEPLRKSNLLDSAIETAIGDSKMVNKLEAANRDEKAVISYTESHNENGEEPRQLIESSKPVHDTSLASELEVLSPSTVASRQSPVPAPRKHINSSIKRYHSLTESVGHFECESLPPIMTQSDDAVSYNTVTAKELIASFNNINGTVKSEKDKGIYKNVAQPKSIGSFVFDRVTKLTNGLSNTRIMGLKRSVSMVADSKSPPPATFYADL